jgi:hypothetical protein
MAFIKQTTLIVSHFQPDYIPPPGVMNPYEVSEQDTLTYETELTNWFSSGKTDGIQYSNEIGTSIRRWLDQESAQAYIDYTLNSIVFPYDVLPSEVNYLITSIPGSEEPN